MSTPRERGFRGQGKEKTPPTTGDPMLVILPREGYENTGEGGMAFFLIVRQREHSSRRQTCITGDIWWPDLETVLKPQTLDKEQPIDAGLLIGSTSLSLFSDEKEEYFKATLKDLKPDGKGLYYILKRLYGKVEIVTLLDT